MGTEEPRSTEEMEEATPLSREENREQLYEKIERKIEAIEKIWELCEELSPPTPHDSLEEISAENGRFDQLKENARSSFAEPALQREVAPSLLDSDMEFLLGVERGIDGLMVKRAQIRSVIQRLGDDYLNPAAYDYYIERFVPSYYPSLRGNIAKVVIHPFSISLITESEKVWKAALGSRATFVAGKHISGSVWNFILGNREMLLRDLKQIIPVLASIFDKEKAKPDDDLVAEQIQRTCLHENVHAVIEEFGFRPSSLGDPAGSFISCLRRLDQLKKARVNRADISESLIEKERALAERRLANLYDNYHYEISADMLSKGWLSLAYSKILTEATAKRVLEVVERENLDVGTTLLEELKGFDVFDIVRRVNALEALVSRKIPDRKGAFYAAMVLFPPSKIRHVERLVERRIREEG